MAPFRIVVCLRVAGEVRDSWIRAGLAPFGYNKVLIFALRQATFVTEALGDDRGVERRL